MRDLLGDIVAGRYAAGEMLPGEQDFVERFGISRGVVRETIRALEERGVLTVRHGRGATVTDTGRWNLLDADVLRALLTGRNARRVAAEVLESRRALEVEAARLAAERRDDEQLAALKSAVEVLRAARNARARGAAEIAFHRALVEATSNQTMIRMHEPLLDATEAIGHVGVGTDTLAEHERILDAIRGRRASAAAAATASHLDAVAARNGSRRRAAAAR